MEVIEAILEMQQWCEALRLKGDTIALVPTMGFFHEGHLELMRVGKRVADHCIISIFVNPTQFGPNEDFEAYPKDRAGDLAKAREVGVDKVFIPSVQEMYPEGTVTTVRVGNLTENLCGASRPGHFNGVTTVVSKLFHIIKPHVAVFGQKDYQQWLVIRRMVKDLNMDIEIKGVPTVREPDGLAMSSRNSYLDSDERQSALSLKKSLDWAAERARRGEVDTALLSAGMKELILGHPGTEIDYIKICHPDTLEDLDHLQSESLIALAVKVGKTRLIDNQIIHLTQ